MAGSHDRDAPERGRGAGVSLDHVFRASGDTVRVQGIDVSLDHVDRLINDVAADHDALITTEQLRALGLRRGAIAHRTARGLLIAMHVGVYRVGPLETPRTRIRAAVLACGRDALASHHAALALYGIRPLPEGPIDVTTVARRARPSGVRSHRTQSLHPSERRNRNGIPLTSPARALLEAAPELTARELANAVEHAQVKRLVTKDELAAVIARAPRRPGVAALRARTDDPAVTRSRAERMLAALLRAAELPEPVFNARVAGIEVDALWERRRVVLEFDSYAFHATRAAFERDRSRTAVLQRARYAVLRTTWTELTKQPYALVARVAEALSAGGPSTSPARAGP